MDQRSTAPDHQTSLLGGSAPSSTFSAQLGESSVDYGSLPTGEQHSNPVAQAKEFISNPVQDLLEVKDELLSVKDFWHDMKKRERTGYHQGTLVLGTVLALAMVSYCLVVKVSHLGEKAPVYSSYLASELGIAALAQLFFSFEGICLENSPMLLIANVNAVGVTVRLALSVHSNLVNSTLSALFLIFILLLTVVHMITSFQAWGGEFTRYITFVIGTEGHIQALYRQYQFMTAVTFMDLEFLAMASMTIFFFLEDSYAATSILVVGFFLVSIGIRSALRHSVRKETTYSFLVLIPIVLGVPVLLGVALLSSHVFDLKLTIPPSCRKSAIFILIWFFTVRVVLLGAVFNCRRNFSKGLKEAFKNERTVRGYFAQRKARTLAGFLARGSAPAVATSEKV